MKVKIVKGKFTATVTGSRVTITCNLCARNPQPDRLDAPLPGRDQLAEAKALMENPPDGKGGAWTHSLARVNAQLNSGSDNAMSTMIVAPVAIVGRASGYQPVVCFHCRQVGLVCVESERPGTGGFGFHPKALNEAPEIHARRRVAITFITMMALDRLLQLGLVPRGASVVCAGASLQCQGKKSTGPDRRSRQDAHQVLRELSINGAPLYQIVNASQLAAAIKNVVTYCHGVISHLDAVYNEADGLVERNITVEMIDLAHLILNGSLRQSSGPYDNVFGRLLWNFVAIRYRYAIRMALIEAPHGAHRDVLLFYSAIADAILQEGPPAWALTGLDGICDRFRDELRML